MTANYCSNCGEALKEFAVVCSGCGKPVPESNRSEQTNAEQQAKESVDAENVQNTPRDAPAKTKSTFIALILSFFFPGLGQVYNGRNKKGTGILAAIYASFLLLVILPGLATAMWGLYETGLLVPMFPLVILIIWVFGLYDAYKDAELINKGEKPYREATAWEVVFFLILPIILTVLLVVGLMLVLMTLRIMF